AGEGPYVKPGFFFQIDREPDPNGNTTADVFTITYAHGSKARFLARHVDVAGQLVFRITEFADRYGNTINYLYDTAGYLVEIVADTHNPDDMDARKLTFSYNAHGRLAMITDYADYT